MEKVEITVFKDKQKFKDKDWITEEIPLTINFNGKEIVTLSCSPRDLKELIYGFLFTSGFIKEKKDIKKLSIDQEKLFVNVETNGKSISEELFFKRIYTSGCGKGILYHNPVDLIQKIKLPLNFTISPEKILALMKKFQKSSLEFKKTGGVHSAALCNEKEILIFKDDIGRHNAVDKVIGEGIISEIDFTDKIILTSGRISSEILLKTNRCKIQIVASFSAPTDQSVRIARELNITLVGFVRGNRMNIYSGEERIK